MQDVLFLTSNLIVNIMVGMNIVLFNHYVYSTKILKRHLIFILVFSISISGLRQVGLNSNELIASISKVSIFIVTFILIKFIIKLNFWRSILIFCLTVISQGIGELIVLGIALVMGIDLMKIASGENLITYFISNVVINLLQMLIILIIKTIKSLTNMASGIKTKSYRFIAINISLAVILITMTLATMIDNQSAINMIISYTLMSLIVLICNILSIGMVLDVDFRDEKLRMQESYNEVLVDLKHKFLGMTSIINAIVDEGDINKLTLYMRELDKGFVERMKNMPTGIKNNKLFYLISTKIKEANEAGIIVKVKVPYEIDEIEGINEDNFVYVINELMSNAIENAGKSAEKEVIVIIENLLDRIKVMIENSINLETIQNKMEILNKKSDKIGRGHGLSQVRKLIGDKTYFKVSITDRFTAELIVDKSK